MLTSDQSTPTSRSLYLDSLLEVLKSINMPPIFASPQKSVISPHPPRVMGSHINDMCIHGSPPVEVLRPPTQRCHVSRLPNKKTTQGSNPPIRRGGEQRVSRAHAACRSACVSSVSRTAPPAASTSRCVTTTRSAISIGGWRGAECAGFPFNPSLAKSACGEQSTVRNNRAGREKRVRAHDEASWVVTNGSCKEDQQLIQSTYVFENAHMSLIAPTPADARQHQALPRHVLSAFTTCVDVRQQRPNFFHGARDACYAKNRITQLVRAFFTLSASNSGLAVVRSWSPVKMEFAPAMNIIAWSSVRHRQSAGHAM